MFEPFFGLTGQPFQLSPDPNFFYGSRGHKRAEAYLQYGLYQGEGFITLTGEVGAGKTTLIRGLLKDLDSSKLVAAQLVSTQLDADNLLRAVATAFGLAVQAQDKAGLLAEIEAFLTSIALEGKRALLIVDEAQNLQPKAVEELRMLSNFQLENRALLQSFLVGQPELRNLMRSPELRQLRQRVLASYHLGPLDQDETRQYIEHRLRQVGWKDDPTFEPEVFNVIHSYTGGIPRRINTLCTRALLAAYLAEEHAITVQGIERVITEFSEEVGEMVSEPSSPLNGAQPSGEGSATLERRVMEVEKAVNLTVKLLRQLIGLRQAGGTDTRWASKR